MAHFREIIKEKNFLILWLGQIISEFGDRLGQMALIALVYKYSPGSAFDIAKLIFFTMVPVFLIGPVAGVYVDKWDRRRIMIISDILRGFLVLMVPFCIKFTNAMWPVYLLVFLTFSINRFFLPSKMAIIPDLVSKDKLLLANSLISTTRMVATIVSIGLAGIIVKLVGAIGGFYIDSVSFFISAGMICFISTKKYSHNLKDELFTAKKAIEEAIKNSSFITSFKNGIKFLLRDKNTKFVLLTTFVLMAGIGALSPIVIVFIQGVFGTATLDIGLLGMFLGIGLFIGAIVYGRFGHIIKRDSAIFLSFLLSGASLIVFSTIVNRSSSFFMAASLICLVGIASAPIVISSNTLLHEGIPTNIRGRVFSSLEIVINFSFLACMFAASILADFLKVNWIIVITGICFCLFAIAGKMFIKR